ncbi:hypothetical protein I302_105505 [Kwoniella bestiolae CBS 10118]|uniref:EamA domain-containing protein n=1 Tax=Kwoniella bestiolae CBS 10118 TaxID=1296100 RepID=A0A1B9FTA8_9TREE|nr:hypothetical protein I302_08786 [Kwoniella bestiolae CBS 10118]OCF22005.1 hypothetical protein I302_08786 [Kwoniella bestiolae CBS 10118]
MTRNIIAKILDSTFAPTALALFSDLMFVLIDGVVQVLEEEHGIPTGQIVFIRMVSTLIFCFVYLSYTHPSFLKESTKSPKAPLIWVRGVNNSLVIILMYASLLYITLSECTVILHLRPFPVGLLCFLILRERFSIVQLVASIISFHAVILVIQPSSLFHPHDPSPSHNRALGFTLAILSTLTSSVDFLLLRKIGKVDPILILGVFACTALLLGPLQMVVFHISPVLDLTAKVWGLLTTVAVCGFLAQVAIVLSLQRASGGSIAILGYLQVVFAMIIQWLFVREMPNWLAGLGMGVIVLAGIWSAYGTEKLEMGDQGEIERLLAGEES